MGKKALKKELIYSRYYAYFMNMAISRFEWSGLPNGIPERRIEEYLINYGQCMFFQDDITGLYAVFKAAAGGTLDVYDIPEMRWGYANQYFFERGKTNSVLMFDTPLGYPLQCHIDMACVSLAEMRIVRDANIWAMRRPFIIGGEPSQELSVKNFFQQLDSGVPFIPIRNDLGGLDIDQRMRVFDFNVPVVFDKLEAEMKMEKNSLLTIMGIDNTTENKKERAITAEINSNDGEIEANRNTALMMRQRAADQINEMFGLNVSVRFRTDIKAGMTDGSGAQDSSAGKGGGGE